MNEIQNKIPEVGICPLCNSHSELVEGFDIDCESTTATIICTTCPIRFGPIYPDTKSDVIEFVNMWNDRLKIDETKNKPAAKCPNCKQLLKVVKQTGGAALNEYQFESVKAGDFYCEQCPDNNRGESGLCYWWLFELDNE